MGNYIDHTPIMNFIDRALSLSDDEAWLFSLSQKDVQNEIIRLNQEQLYDDGIDSEGRDLGTYRPFTIKIKREKGQRYDHVTLFDTGEFYASFRVIYDENSFTVIADGDKGDKNLFDVYGDDITGLIKFNLERIKPVILQYYVKYAQRKLLR